LSGGIINLTLNKRPLSDDSISSILFSAETLQKMSDFNSVLDFKSDKELFDLIQTGIGSLDLSAIYEQIRYQGFNRSDYLASALKVMSPSTMVKIAMIGAVRGSNFDKISKSPNLPLDVKSLMDGGTILSKKPTKTTDVTITRCTAALPQWSAYALNIAGVQPRIGKSTVPACLQFPAAGSLPMSKTVRVAHIDFSVKFSKLIGGKFKTTIYKAMYNDAVSVSTIHADVLAHLGVTKDEDNVVDIDDLLKDYVEDDDESEEEDTKPKNKRKRSKR